MAIRKPGACMLSFRRIGLLLWKNILFRRRHYIVTAFEIILPTVMAIALVYLRSAIQSDITDDGNPPQEIDGTIFEEYTEQSLSQFQLSYCPMCDIIFSPNNSLTNRIIDGYIERTCETNTFDCEAHDGIRKFGVDTERNLESIFVDYLNSPGPHPIVPNLGIVFDSGFEKDGEYSKDHRFSYKIRSFNIPADTKELIPWFQQPGPDAGNAVAYAHGGFLSVQYKIEKAIIEAVTGTNPTQNISIQAMPYPPYSKVSDFNQIYFLLLPQFLVLGFVFIVPSIVRVIVSEKETGIKELMKMMGLPGWMHWMGWMINSMLVLAVSTTIVVVVFFVSFDSKAGPFVQYGDPTLWWFILFVYGISLTSFCFFISSPFERPTLATILGIIVYLVSYNALAQTLELRYEDLSLAEKLSSCLLPNVALHLALKVMGGFEGNAIGTKWSNFAEPASTVDSLTVAHCFLMMVIDAVLYWCLAAYIENIIPSKFGVRKPWYYIFLPSTYYCGRKPIGSENTVASISPGENAGQPGFETEPVGLAAGIVVKNLRKVFDNHKVAVNNVSCKIYAGHITALLGHNGAGKTTTMSILTGMLAPTSGTATINGFDINSDMDSIRANLGLCPQHNMLFDKLTVREHLIFFGRLKGMSSSAAQAEMETLLEKLQLKEKKNTLSMALSGGQKRKLSLGMALIGGTKVVILDEPTSGMDPEARRAIWDILLKMRGERTILLTTHFMEEADILGDRIAIMSQGKLQCLGTPMYLKQFYGAGYSLKMTISPNSPANPILQVVQKYIPGAFIKSHNTTELSITLPSGDQTTSLFPKMFLELSEQRNNLQILTVGISLTTMDEVFVKVGELSDDSTSDEMNSNDSKSRNTAPRSTSTRVIRVSGIHLILLQFWGLLLKRILYTLGKYRMFFLQLIVPVLMVIATVLISNSSLTGSNSSPPLKMDLSSYRNAKTYYSTQQHEGGDLGQNYDSVAAVGSSVTNVDNNIIEALLQSGVQDLGSYRAHHIVAAEFNDSSAHALFSTIPNHAAPLALNLISNAILRSTDPGKNGYTIDVTVQEIHTVFTMDDAIKISSDASTIVAILFGVLLPFGLASVAASYLIFPVEERLCQAKQLQLMTGVSPLLYWLTSYLWDFFLLAIVVGIMVACFPIFENYGAFTANGGIGALFLIFFVYGFAAISFSYLFSQFVATVAGGFAVVVLIHLATGMILSMVVFIAERSGSGKTIFALRVIGTFFPTFSASTGLMKYTAIANVNSRCNIIKDETLELICRPGFEMPFGFGGQECCENCDEFPSGCFVPKPYITWEWDYRHKDEYTVPGIGQDLVYLGALGLIYFGLTQLVEYGVLRMIFSLCVKSNRSDFKEMSNDDDVLAETQRVRSLISSGRIREDALIVSDMCKSFGSMAAVSKLSFGVHHGECFGLLGVNGAGKTTTFRMLTGDEICSNGNAFAVMYNLLNSRSNFLANIGYCPQFDGIVGVLSGRQMLDLFARLRGIPSASVAGETDRWLHKLGLYNDGGVQCEKYSGGMKRRLSAAMALVGDLPLILLDEPTSGVDPVARRQFWTVIESVRNSGQAVILTSHSMEECEALCSRLGIMVNGQFQCMGGVQHLKNKFAQGYSVLLKLKPLIPQDSPEIASLNNAICSKLHPCSLKDNHQNVLKYQVYNTKISWDVLFTVMEEFKTQYVNILEDYTVNETSLEEVFLSFARKQYPNRTANVSFFRKFITCKL